MTFLQTTLTTVLTVAFSKSRATASAPLITSVVMVTFLQMIIGGTGLGIGTGSVLQSIFH